MFDILPFLLQIPLFMVSPSNHPVVPSSRLMRFLRWLSGRTVVLGVLLVHPRNSSGGWDSGNLFEQLSGCCGGSGFRLSGETDESVSGSQEP